ncbi:hypothetical protein G7K_1237-t1 [Saitoella complicata NRRL Y-17804]|uniref:Uncharacterized protein n=1 Tax=Saitoella complicata (strain BCRC 22490 / CBS 7301 / JCM 7358 / NBRC 10748 / NRRL Y-17804) TaxID=698492 RepID=A0A0E9NB42_SAICN|nr:hypothetical protein G7K_1237-t1 [Saitoella complicata NRRL Y-17804]
MNSDCSHKESPREISGFCPESPSFAASPSSLPFHANPPGGLHYIVFESKRISFGPCRRGAAGDPVGPSLPRLSVGSQPTLQREVCIHSWEHNGGLKHLPRSLKALYVKVRKWGPGDLPFPHLCKYSRGEQPGGLEPWHRSAPRRALQPAKRDSSLQPRSIEINPAVHPFGHKRGWQIVRDVMTVTQLVPGRFVPLASSYSNFCLVHRGTFESKNHVLVHHAPEDDAKTKKEMSKCGFHEPFTYFSRNITTLRMRIRRKPDFLLRTIFQEQRRPLHRTFHICFWGDNHHSFHLFQEWATTTWHVAHSQTNGVFPGCCVRISLQEPVFTGGAFITHRTL